MQSNQEQKKLYFLETDSFQLEKVTAIASVYDWKFGKSNIPVVLAKYRKQSFDGEQCKIATDYTSFNLDYKFNTACNQRLLGMFGNSELIKRRNDEWMKQLPVLLENNNCFIAVGLGHLYFECGLIVQLRRLGFTVEEVKVH